MGIEPGRLHFSWISSAEATKFVEEVKEIKEQVRKLGPAERLIKRLPVVDQNLAIPTRHYELGTKHPNDSK
jgi:hypothetical protein